MTRPRVLIADDEQHIVHLLSQTLRRRGYEVLTAGNGERAWQLLQAFDVDLLISDQSMPGMTGEELSDKLAGSIPVIIVTSKPQYTLPDDGRPITLLHKPFSPNDIAAKVESLIGPGGQPREQSA